MIISICFDTGEPHYMSVIDSWTDAREAVWHIKYRALSSTSEYDEIVDWLDSNCEAGYDYTYRFNSGDPYMSIEMLSEPDVVAFKMRFGK